MVLAVHPFLYYAELGETIKESNYNMAKINRKTYGVTGMMEFIAIIYCGKTQVKVPFTGGSLSGYGVTPAKYTTENPMIQAVIENSDYFKSGKIMLMYETEGTGKYKECLATEHAHAGTHLPGQATTVSAIAGTALDDSPAAELPGTERGATADAAATVAADAAATEAGTAGETAGTVAEYTTADGKPIIDVSCIDDARDYLVEEFGYTRSNLRSDISVRRAAEEKGIVFRGLDE